MLVFNKKFAPQAHCSGCFENKRYLSESGSHFRKSAPFSESEHFRLQGHAFRGNERKWAESALFTKKCTFREKVHFPTQNALSRPRAADAYKTIGIFMKRELFLAQKRFWAEKCILGSKNDFGA